MLRLLAPAKINLALEVLGRRRDGYHEVRTVLQAVDLCDELTFQEADELSLQVEPPGAAPVQDNLVLQAAERLRHASGVSFGATITLGKRIPMAGGLGGGSSDAAAALLGLAQLWGLDLTIKDLANLAADLGSDVPFFLAGGTALAEGRGERLSPLPLPRERFAVILALEETDGGMKTKRLYSLLQPTHFTGGKVTEDLVRKLYGAKPVRDSSLNAFEEVAPRAFTEYSAARAAFVSAGARRVLLSGAGPSLFALSQDEGDAREIHRRLAADGHKAFTVRLLPPWDEHGYRENQSKGEDYAAR